MNRNELIIIGLLIVIIALLVGIGVAMMAPAKEDVKLTMNNDTVYEGESIEIQLTDVNGTPISGQTVNISVTDEKGASDYHSVVTDSNGIGELELNKSSGNYTVNCTYGGDDRYNSANTSQKLEIKEEVVEVATQSSGPSNTITYDADLNVYYDSNGIVVDPDGQHPMEVGSKYSDLVDRKERWERGELEM